jgi:hypothetical protein
MPLVCPSWLLCCICPLLTQLCVTPPPPVWQRIHLSTSCLATASCCAPLLLWCACLLSTLAVCGVTSCHTTTCPSLSVLWQDIQTVATTQGLSEITWCVQRCEESSSKKTSGLESSAQVHSRSTVFDPMSCMGPEVGSGVIQ